MRSKQAHERSPMQKREKKTSKFPTNTHVKIVGKLWKLLQIRDSRECESGEEE